MGFLSSFIHSSKVVFPCDQFDPDLVLDAVVQQKCTVILGVPTMFIAEMEANRRKGYKIETLRLGLASGSPVPAPLMRELRRDLGIQKTLIAYGMTETSPVTFITPMEDPDELRATTVGKVFPHTSAKIVDRNGAIVPRGVPGELCTSGFALQKGYWKNEEKTAEAMKVDKDGVRWMHTGDECVITDAGYCIVTGRIKDLIIRGMTLRSLVVALRSLVVGLRSLVVALRSLVVALRPLVVALRPLVVEGDIGGVFGAVVALLGYVCLVLLTLVFFSLIGGENISPVEIEDRLLEHEAIAEASVVGLKDAKYGEVVGCFLRLAGDADAAPRPENAEIHQWCRQRLGSHKAPVYVFWIGDPEVGPDFPKTGSGKHQKHLLRALGNKLIDAKPGLKAKL